MASKAKATRQTPLSARERRKQAREDALKARRNQNMMLIGSAVLLLLIIGYFIYLNFRPTPLLAGEQAFESQGNNHIDFGSRAPITYNSTPPTSGPHYPNITQWQIYDEPIRYEQLVHNMEDGGVIIYYQCEEECPELIEQLTEVVQPHVDNGNHVVMAPNDPTWTAGGSQTLHEDMGSPIVLTAWGRMMRLDEFDAEQVDNFIRRYEGIDHHSGR